MKIIKRILKGSIVLFGLPALIIHEISHYLVALAINKKPFSIEINIFSFRHPMNGLIKIVNPGNDFRSFLVNIAPIIPIIITAILSFNIIACRFLMLYELLAFHYSFLSDVDLNRV